MSNTTISPAATSLASAGGAVLPAGFVPGITPAAAIRATTSPVSGDAGVTTAAWSLAQGQSGAPIGPLSQPWTWAQFTASGTLGAGGCLVIQASADGNTWQTLGGSTDFTKPGYGAYGGANGDAQLNVSQAGKFTISVTAPGAGELQYLRPVIQGGDGTTSVSVTAKLSGTGPL